MLAPKGGQGFTEDETTDIMRDNKQESSSSVKSTLQKPKRGRSASTSDLPKLQKPKRGRSASASDLPKMHWKDEWDNPFLELLQAICQGHDQRIGREFNNPFWKNFAKLLCTKVNRLGITAEDCKERGKFFAAKYCDYKGTTPVGPHHVQLYNIYQCKFVPRFPRDPASSGSLGSSSRARSRRSGGPSTEQPWKSALCDAISVLVRHHGLSLQVVEEIEERFRSEIIVRVFLDLCPVRQMEEIVKMIGPNAQQGQQAE